MVWRVRLSLVILTLPTSPTFALDCSLFLILNRATGRGVRIQLATNFNQISIARRKIIKTRSMLEIFRYFFTS